MRFFPRRKNSGLSRKMETTEFMLQLGKQLMDERKVAESTAAAYLKSLYALNGKKPFKNLTFLKNTEGVEKVIGEYAETTQRALLAAIVSVLSLFKDKPTYKKVYNHYYEKMMERSKIARATEDTHEKTEKQKTNWLSWEEVAKRRAELAEEVGKFGKTLRPVEFDKLLQYLVLSLYTDIQPRRNQDYLDMYIVKRWTDKMPTDKNYLDMATKRFIFNKYKTSKKYGTQTSEIPESLWGVLSVYLNHHPLWKGVAKRKADPVKLLVLDTGAPVVAVNGITRLLNRVFGKKIGSSMLRHIYLSDKYKDTVASMEEDSKAMGHSVELQRAYVKSDDAAPKNEVIEM